MHYIINNRLIKSENAATCTSQTNAFVLSYISSLPSGITALDYGCGKCRYSKQLSERTARLTIVDSEIQITRKQKIHGETTTVKEYAETNLQNTTAYSLEDNEWKKEHYDFILCTNVLSAIPNVLERYTVLRNIAELLSKDGCSLITVQYKNSYFSTYSNNPTAIKHEDGWIIKRGSSYSFYGIIQPNILVEMCTQSGLSIIKNINKDGSIYLLVRKSK